jgi:hypothetical protein
MTKLSDTQAVILSVASQRDDGAVLPLPEALKIKGGAVDKVLGSLKAKGLIDHQGASRGDDPPPLRITRAGLQAIGVETEDDASEGAMPADTGATSAEAGAQATDTRPRRPKPTVQPRRLSERPRRKRPRRSRRSPRRLRRPIGSMIRPRTMLGGHGARSAVPALSFTGSDR